MKSIRIGEDLHDRMQSLVAKFGRSVNWIGNAAVREWEKNMQGVELTITDGFSTQREGGAVLKIDTDRPAEEVRAIIDHYCLPYESEDIKVPSFSKRVIEDIKAYNEAVIKYGQPKTSEVE